MLLNPSIPVRCALLVGALAGCGSDSNADVDGGPTSTPEAQGVDSNVLADIVERIDDENLPIDSLLMARNGVVLLDAYFYPYLGDRPHDVASVTKSVTSTLVGIAIDEGLLSLDQAVTSIFPSFGAPKQAIEIQHLLNMSSGLGCGLSPGEPELFEMIGSANFVDYALDLPVIAEPQTQFAYCSPGSHLLSAAIGQVVGMGTEEFARERLFEPIGITDFVWPTDPQGVARGWGDLQLHPRDAARIGQLFLDEGRWGGEAIVSTQWVEEATENRIDVDARGTGYGYQWWILPPPFDGAYEARGRGGQAILVWPEREIVVVFTGRGIDVRGDVAPALLAAIASEEPLPANPAAAERLAAATTQALEPPRARAIAPLPSAAAAMSGRRYALDENPFDTRCVMLRFDADDEVTFELTTGDGTFSMPVGMDDVPRFSEESPTGIPIGLVGQWTSPEVFLLSYDEVAGLNHLRVEVTVSGDANTIEVQFTDPGGYFPTVTVAGEAGSCSS